MAAIQNGILTFMQDETNDATVVQLAIANNDDIRGISAENLTHNDMGALLERNWENCKGVMVPRGKCLTVACEETRWNTDTTGFCRRCKETKGMLRSPSYVKKAIPAEQRTGITKQPELTANPISLKIMEHSLTTLIDNMDGDQLRGLIRTLYNGMTHKEKQELVTMLIDSHVEEDEVA